MKQNDKAFLRLQEDLKALGGTDDMPVLFTTAETAAASVSGMSPEYFETHFEHLADWTDCPPQFVTITGYATTGERWPEEKNQAADRELEAELRGLKRWMRRLTGFSPTTGHREPGWAVALDLKEACEIGLKYKQDAIYHVAGDALSVSFCDARRALVPVGRFQSRLQLGPKAVQMGSSAGVVEQVVVQRSARVA